MLTLESIVRNWRQADYIPVLVVIYGISNTIVLEIP